METHDPKYEEAANKLLEKLKSEDPYFEQRVEFGTLLMKHVNDFTNEERKRFKELEEFLKDKN